jgi:hypothetical protein
MCVQMSTVWANLIRVYTYIPTTFAAKTLTQGGQISVRMCEIMHHIHMFIIYIGMHI